MEPPFSTMNYIYKWWIFHSYVRLPEGIKYILYIHRRHYQPILGLRWASVFFITYPIVPRRFTSWIFWINNFNLIYIYIIISYYKHCNIYYILYILQQQYCIYNTCKCTNTQAIWIWDLFARERDLGLGWFSISLSFPDPYGHVRSAWNHPNPKKQPSY